MLALFGLFFSLMLYFTVGHPPQWGQIAYIGASISLLLSLPIVYGLGLLSIQKAQKSCGPQAAELFRQDWGIHGLSLMLSLFALLSIGFLALPATAFFFWLPLFGGALDLLFALHRRWMRYTSPMVILEKYRLAAEQASKGEDVAQIAPWMEALNESAVRAVERGQFSLISPCFDNLATTVDTYGKRLLEIEHTVRSPDELARLRYPLYYLLQQMEFLFLTALDRGFYPVATKVITLLGKVGIRIAPYNLSMFKVTVHTIGKLAQEAQFRELPDLPEAATTVLVRMGKDLFRSRASTGENLSDSFISLSSNLERINQEMFRQHKDIPIELLEQPFRELAEITSGEEYKDREDIQTIQKDLTRIIEDFVSLRAVMGRIDAMPEEPATRPPPQEDEQG